MKTKSILWIIIIVLLTLKNNRVMSQNVDYASYAGEFASYFVQSTDGASKLPFLNELDIKLLDYSIESLKVLDVYLNFLNENQSELSEEDVLNIIVWNGCYTGEIIKKNSNLEYQWINYKDFVNASRLWKKIRRIRYTFLFNGDNDIIG